MSDVLERVRGTIEANRLLAPGDRVVAGVSGGPDSLCLLHILTCLRDEYSLGLHVAHLHHGLRGAEADADARFVTELAAAWGLPCTVERVDVPALAQARGLAFEEAARRARYAFLERVARTESAGVIAVGHNADDQAETVLMHWMRGAGLAGLRGMLLATRLADYRLLDEGVPEASGGGLRLIRPLLEVPRSEVEAYCDEQGLQPRFDRSNLDTTYFRNWLRHEVLPLLAQHNPNIREVIRRSARVIADDYALLRSLLEEAWPDVVAEEAASGYVVFCLDAWRALPVALQRATLREAVHRLRRSLRNINFVHIEDALPVARDGATGNRATLPGHLMLTVGYERLTIADADSELVPIPPEWPLLAASVDRLAVAVPGRTPLPDSSWLLEAALRMRENLPGDWEANRDPWRAFLDADRAGSDLWLRTRRPGDRFAPLGMRGRTVKSADFLTNQKVPRALRDRLPILEGPEGIVWVCGQRISDVVRIQAGTEQILELRFVKAG